MRPASRNGPIPDYDNISSASGAYVGKRATSRATPNPLRGMSAQHKTIRLTPNARTFYPEGYYKRVGYQKSDATSANSRVDALGQRVRDRFNEEIVADEKAKTSGGLHHRTLKQLKQAHNKTGGPNS
jgi:hypothetical protein